MSLLLSAHWTAIGTQSCGPEGTWYTSVVKEKEQYNLPQHCSEFRSVQLTKPPCILTELSSLPHITQTQTVHQYLSPT